MPTTATAQPTNTQHIVVDAQMRVCINCTHYRRYYLEQPVPGEAYKKMLPVGTGWCKYHGKQRGALRQPCKDYETKN